MCSTNLTMHNNITGRKHQQEIWGARPSLNLRYPAMYLHRDSIGIPHGQESPTSRPPLPDFPFFFLYIYRFFLKNLCRRYVVFLFLGTCPIPRPSISHHERSLLCYVPGYGLFAVEPGAFVTARANPRTCPQRDATSPAPSQHGARKSHATLLRV
ncbi:uncharacterized protein F4807DRAFT_82891 [Annulohypoxylon truncatum]|uniref:uncharacterized protein n=1 Tax=Annulohypoxylon truncatum TaxID=327061 RepID=UPI002008B154|nr:uncharacterized protein F4807DRAFT_82891 [Annulohypoxylon truncatum]KAI1210044.1 hypothetical protein F4807DRAFT_82891 [Annulohypoxylon truncatum]